MGVISTRHRVCIGSLIFMALCWLLYWWNGVPCDRRITPEQHRIIESAWAYHGRYPAVVQIDTIYLESPRGRIWIERNGERIWPK